MSVKQSQVQLLCHIKQWEPTLVSVNPLKSGMKTIMTCQIIRVLNLSGVKKTSTNTRQHNVTANKISVAPCVMSGTRNKALIQTKNSMFQFARRIATWVSLWKDTYSSIEILLKLSLHIIAFKINDRETLTKCPIFSPVMLGCLPIAHRRQSTSWIVLSFSSSFFLSGSLVAIVTSSPLSVLHTDLTWEFFQRSMPEFWSSLVQFVLMRLSKFLRTCAENSDISLRVHSYMDLKMISEYLSCGLIQFLRLSDE